MHMIMCAADRKWHASGRSDTAAEIRVKLRSPLFFDAQPVAFSVEDEVNEQTEVGLCHRYYAPRLQREVFFTTSYPTLGHRANFHGACGTSIIPQRTFIHVLQIFVSFRQNRTGTR